MNRRSFIAVSLIAAVAEAKPTVSCLVAGDSIAAQLAPRLGKRLKRDGRERIGYECKAGESARNFLVKRWFRDAVARYTPCPVVVSLGVNCVKQERPKLAETIAALDELAGWRAIWLAPNREGYAFDLGYLHDALREAGVAALWLPKLRLESDNVHFTEFSYSRIVDLLIERL